MKAVQINKYGGLEVLEVNLNAVEPTLGAGQVLVEVHATSINPFDYFIIGGFMAKMVPLQFPSTMGGDFSGKIIKVDEKVTDFKVGDNVYGTAIVLSGGSGALAEIATVNPDRIAIQPKDIDFTTAASLPLVGSSAIQTLEDEIKLKANPTFAKATVGKQKILIHGGAGGIGSVAIQLAKHLGAYVATTVSGDDKEFVKSLGADEIIDYKTEKFEEKLKDFDAVYDTIGGEVMEKSFQVLKKDGIIASMKGQPNPELATQYGVTGIAINTKTNTDHLKRLTLLVESGVIKPQIDKVFNIDQAVEAYKYKKESHPRGKVVIKIK